MERFYFIAGALALIAIWYGVSWFRNSRRLGVMEKMAQSMNFTYLKKGDEKLFELMSGFNLFRQGYSRNISNIITGSVNGVPLTFFDYSYTTGGGKNSSNRRQSVVLFQSDKMWLPEFILRPKTLSLKIGQAFSHKDIVFEAYQAFTKQYSLRGPDEPAVRNLFKDQVLSYYERNSGWCAEGDSTRLALYRAGKRAKPEKLQSFLDEAYEIFNLFKK